MNKDRKIIIAAVLLILLIPFAVSTRYRIGVSADKAEADARQSQKVPADWQCAKAENDYMVAMLFYPQDKSESIFSVYVKDSSILFGYGFVKGGAISAIDESALKITVDPNKSGAVLSLNNIGVAKVQLSDGTSIDVDENTPFVHIIPPHGNVWLYDARRNIIDYGIR